MKKHLFTLTLFSVLAIPAASHAEFKGGSIDIGIHYLDWTSRATEESLTKPHKNDLGYLELEGGANFSWGETYGSFDQENFYNGRHDKPGSKQRYTLKNANRIYLGDTGFNLYLRAYSTYGSTNRASFHNDMPLHGIGYNSIGSGWWSKPFFAKRYIDQTCYTNDSDYVASQVVGYSFMLGNGKFTLTNQNEYGFGRDATCATGSGGKEDLNGAVALRWNATSYITTGTQYHYVDDKLGEDLYQDAIICSIKLDF